MTRIQNDCYREILQQAASRYLTVRPEGIRLDPEGPAFPEIDVQILAHGPARTLYRGRKPVCRSLDGVVATRDSERSCEGCPDRKGCTPQVRVDLLHDWVPYRLLLSLSSARNFLAYVAQLPPDEPIDGCPTRIRVLEHETWGELVFVSLRG